MAHLRSFNIPLFLLVFSILFSSSFANLNVHAVSPESDIEFQIRDIGFDYSSILSSINISAVHRHVDFFTGLGTRATGYPGNIRAAEYIYDRLVEYGAENVSYEEFPAVTCLSFDANITILDENTVIPIHPLVPNLVVPSTTPPQGITGKLVYAGKGNLVDFDGLDVDGSIVLMDWGSEANWLNAARLGAKAVVFLPPKPSEITYSLYGSTRDITRFPTTRGPVSKFLWDAPLNFPRFYVESSDPILGMIDRTVRLVSTQRWVKTIGRNVVGFIRGEERPEGIVILSSYYDSYSVVPTVAPGAQEALGVSALLEIAKFLNQENHKPPLTIMIVAYGGHHQGLAGSFSFSNEYYFPAQNETRKDIGRRIWRQYNLDLSSGSDHVFMTYEGGTFLAHNVPKSLLGGFLGHENNLYERVVNEYRDDLIKSTGVQYNFNATLGYDQNEQAASTLHPYLMPTKQFAYDHEPTICIGPPGWTFTTAKDPRPYYWEPFDTIQKIDWENVKLQLEIIYTIVLRSIYEYDTVFDPTFDYAPPSISSNTWEWGGRQNWATIKGEVATWTDEIGWYRSLDKSDLTGLSNIIVFFKGTRPLDRRFVFAEDDGSFEIRGGILSIGYTSTYVPYQISAWVIDPINGNPVYVPDQGQHAYDTPDLRAEDRDPLRRIGFLTVFKASTLAVLDFMYPNNLGMPQIEETGEYRTPQIDVYDSKLLTAPDSFGTFTEDAQYQRVCILAFPPNKSVEISAKAPWSRYPFLLLTNGTDYEPLGHGYSSEGQVLLPFPILACAEDLYHLNIDRLKTLGKFTDITKLPSNEYNNKAKKAIEDASRALQERDYSKAYSLAIDAWFNGREAYLSSRYALEDTTSAVAFFAFLIVPFVVLSEKLLLDMKGVKKAASLLVTFTLTMLALNLAHPGFSVAASPVSMVIGFSVLILSAPILFIIIGESRGYMRRIRIKEIGKHEIAVSRLDQTIHAFNTGVENMKKRRFRTILTTLSIVIMISSVVGFTSLSALRVPASTLAAHPSPPYVGVYVRRELWGRGRFELGQPMLDYLVGKYDQQALIIPRAWRYNLWPSTIGNVPGWGEAIGFIVHYNGKYITPKALLGLCREETSLTNLELFLIEGGRWFTEHDTKVCMISQGQAQDLGISPEDLPVTITVEGIPFSVIGIVTAEAELVGDLDSEGITPVKRDLTDNPWTEHLTVDEMMLMPYQTVIDMGGGISNVALRLEDPSIVRLVADEIYRTLPSSLVYSNLEDEVLLSRAAVSLAVAGLENQIAPLTIVMLALFNIMLGSIYERKKEVGIYASIGLSPLHVASLFLAETMVYAILGGILGYLGAVVQVRTYEAIMHVRIADYSSSTVGMAVAFSIFATILSTLYPAYISSKLVTPSLERAWKIPTKPVGDLWEIPLPFTASSRPEARGIISYLHEFLIQQQVPGAPVFMASDLQIEEGTVDERTVARVSAHCRLAPYQIGVTQKLEVVTFRTEETRWEFRVLLERTGGAVKEWVRLNRSLLNVLREQFLIWRTLSETERRKYQEASFLESA